MHYRTEALRETRTTWRRSYTSRTYFTCVSAYLQHNPSQLCADLSPIVDDTLAGDRLDSLFKRSEEGRVEFLGHLKSLGVEKLADRQLFVNALGRAKRAGMFEERCAQAPEQAPP